jgi:hypothetical protein
VQISARIVLYVNKNVNLSKLRKHFSLPDMQKIILIQITTDSRVRAPATMHTRPQRSGALPRRLGTSMFVFLGGNLPATLRPTSHRVL